MAVEAVALAPQRRRVGVIGRTGGPQPGPRELARLSARTVAASAHVRAYAVTKGAWRAGCPRGDRTRGGESPAVLLRLCPRNAPPLVCDAPAPHPSPPDGLEREASTPPGGVASTTRAHPAHRGVSRASTQHHGCRQVFHPSDICTLPMHDGLVRLTEVGQSSPDVSSVFATGVVVAGADGRRINSISS